MHDLTIGVEFGARLITIEQNQIKLQIWDTAGQEDYARLRPLSYPNTDVFVLTYSVMSPLSFESLRTKFSTEIKYFAPGVPFIIVGTKTDLREDAEALRKLRDDDEEPVKEPVTLAAAQALGRELGAKRVLECSARTGEGLQEVIDAAVRCTFRPVLFT